MLWGKWVEVLYEGFGATAVSQKELNCKYYNLLNFFC